MTALLAALKSLASWLLANALDPRAWAVALIIFSAGFIKGCAEEKLRLDSRIAVEEAVAKAQAARSKLINDTNRATRKEFEDAAISEMARLGELLDDANRRVLERADRGIVPRPSPGAAGPVHAGQAVESAFLARVYGGETVCYDAAELDTRIRGGLDRLLGRLARLAEPAVDAISDTGWWGQWAEKVGSCDVPPLPDQPSRDPPDPAGKP